MTFSHRLMAFLLVAGLSADMGVYRNSTMIRGRLFYFVKVKVRKRKVCHVLAIHFRLKCSIDGDIYFVRSSFRHIISTNRWQIQGIRFFYGERTESSNNNSKRGSVSIEKKFPFAPCVSSRLWSLPICTTRAKFSRHCRADSGSFSLSHRAGGFFSRQDLY